jgi:tetratricopeptide (TPR) repeat protein
MSMKTPLVLAVCLFIMIVIPATLTADDFMGQGNILLDRGTLNHENYKTAGDLFVKALEANPSSYEAAWKAARAYREYADASQMKLEPNWKALCKQYGKLGMRYGEKAIALNPDGVEGNFWYGCSVGDYADAVSFITAITEGLKDKTQKSFEKAYQLNRMYNDGGPMVALGRFWYVLPWPIQDRKLSLKYLREFQRYFPHDARGQVYLAETLLATGDKDEARSLLKKASSSSENFFAEWAKRLLAEM